MYPLLILREEIVCLVILLFLFGIAAFYKMGKDVRIFHRLTAYVLVHGIFDIITVLTVNNLETVPEWLNWCAHVIFYFSAILFSGTFFNYTVQLCNGQRAYRTSRKISAAIAVAYLIVLPFLPIDYLVGNGTNYSYGMAAFVGYGLGLGFFIASAVTVCLGFKRLEPHEKMALLPMLAFLIAMELTQIVVPELLFTSGLGTIVMVAFFFSLENPAVVFRRKLMVDALTGVGSRHSYEEDLANLERRHERNPSLVVGMAFCDINELKKVNNTYGHMEGDVYITAVAQILMRELKSADKIYRLGGDEFLAVFENRSEKTVRAEIAAVQAACERESAAHSYPVGVSIGYASLDGEYKSIADVLRAADYLMYQNKAEMRNKNALCEQDGSRTLNLTGLTSRVLDAFIAMDDTNFHYIYNLETSVARVSPGLVELFDLPGEFMQRFDWEWRKNIHPEDVQVFDEDVGAMLIRRKSSHHATYRVKTRRGEYVECTCRGFIVTEQNGGMDLFMGNIALTDGTEQNG